MNNTTEYYLHNIDTALSFIVESLSNNEQPELADIASAANLSKFHFHRIYRLVTGETCQQTIARIKLAIAANTLTHERGSVTMAAMNASYSSSQALAKALKRETGHTATQLQQDPEKLSETIAQLKIPAEQSKGLISIELTQLEPIKYIAHQTNLPYEQLNSIYEQLFIQAGDPSNVAAIIGFSLGNQPDLITRGAEFECGLILEDNEVHMTKVSPSASYLRARHSGSYDQLDESIDELYQYALGQHDTRVENVPILFHYLDDPEQVAASRLRTDIYLPISLDH